mgnify:CR=1 FL=1
MEQFDPADLLLFVHVADAGGFSRAAERAGLPKATVSRRIARLEERLGERLLLRTTRRLRLTEFGLQMLDHACQVADEVSAVAALAESRRATPSGRLRVSMPSDFANLLLADALAGFVARHPAVVLELDLSARRVDLLAENFDLVVRFGDLPDDALLAARRLAVFEIGLYAAPDYLDRRGEPAGPDDLVRHAVLHLLEQRGQAPTWHLRRGEQTWQGTPFGRAAVNSPELLIRLARAGAGIALVPDAFADAALRAGQLRRVLPDWHAPGHVAWAVFPGRRLMPAKTRAFLDMLEQALASLAQRTL